MGRNLGIWRVGALACVACVACGSKSTTGSVDARQDASTTAIDSRFDAGAHADEVACGTLSAPTTCSLATQACCDFSPGSGTDYCYTIGSGVCEGGTPVHCDGPEDCMNGLGCCYVAGSGATCTEQPTCAPAGGRIMCHVGDSSACGTNGLCCPLHSGIAASDSVFGACYTGGCPG